MGGRLCRDDRGVAGTSSCWPPGRAPPPGCARTGGAGGECAAGLPRAPAGIPRCLHARGFQFGNWQCRRHWHAGGHGGPPPTDEDACGEGHSLLARSLQRCQPHRRLLQALCQWRPGGVVNRWATPSLQPLFACMPPSHASHGARMARLPCRGRRGAPRPAAAARGLWTPA